MSISYRLRFVLCTTFCLAAFLLQAQTPNTWIGGSGNNWKTDANWSEGISPNDGTTSTYDAIFDDPSSVPTAVLSTDAPGPDVDANTVTFNQAGWSITGPSDPVQLFAPDGDTHVTSNGAGVNYLPGLSGGAGAGVGRIFTAAGNTLVLTGNTTFGGLKYGNGTLVIDSGINYTTPKGGGNIGLNVFAGTVLINGSLTDNNFGYRTHVQSGGTLGGTGEADQTNRVQYHINSGGTFNPGGDGTFGSSIGTFTLSNSRGSGDRDSDFYFNSGSIFHVDIDNAGNSDHFALQKGAANADAEVRLIMDSGVTLDLWGTPAFNTEYDLISLTGAQTIYDGTAFDTVNLNGVALTEGVDFMVDYTAKIEADTGVGGVKLTLIPEPSSVMLVLFAAGMFVIAFSRRR